MQGRERTTNVYIHKRVVVDEHVVVILDIRMQFNECLCNGPYSLLVRACKIIFSSTHAQATFIIFLPFANGAGGAGNF